MPHAAPRAPRLPWRLAVIALWAAALALLLPFALGLEDALDARARVAGSEHARAEALLAREFDTPLADPLLLVVEGLDPRDYGAGVDTLDGLIARIAAAAPEARIYSYLDSGDALYVGADGDSTLVLVAPPDDPDARAAVADEARAAAAAYVAREAPQLRLSWTSESMINDELRELSARDADAAELRVLPLALIVLFVAFGSATAGLTPVVLGVLTVAIARGALALIDQAAPLSILTANVAAMLGLALTVDYALLVVSRFREELARDDDAGRAAAAAARSAGRTLVLSGLGVAIAFAALLIVPVNEVRSIAIAGLVVVASAVAVSTLLLPAILALVGSRIDLLLSVRRRLAPSADRLWSGWARIVFARPIAFLLLGAAPLLALSLAAARLDITLPRGDWLPGSARAAAAMDALDRVGRTGLLETVLVAAQLEAVGGAETESGWRALDELGDRLAADPRVEAVRSIRSVTGPDDWRRLDAVPDDARRGFLSDDSRMALIAVVPRADLELHDYAQLVRDIRDAPRVPGVAALTVGGAPALTADYVDALRAWFLPVAAAILLATFLVLALGLRSVLLPLKAVALNLLSVSAALGAMTLVFQEGFGAGVLGLAGGSQGVFPIVPVLVFAIVFGLSMDYEVFLFGRVVEAHRRGASDRDALAVGLRATAGLITSAAALMIIVFGAFMFGEFLLMKMLGFTLAFAILIDALVVRLMIGPALFAIAGRWNWWPSSTVFPPARGADVPGRATHVAST